MNIFERYTSVSIFLVFKCLKKDKFILSCIRDKNYLLQHKIRTSSVLGSKIFGNSEIFGFKYENLKVRFESIANFFYCHIKSKEYTIYILLLWIYMYIGRISLKLKFRNIWIFFCLLYNTYNEDSHTDRHSIWKGQPERKCRN